MEGEKNPKVLLEYYQSGKIDNRTFSNSLISLIENSDDSVVRIESIKLLNEIDLGDLRSIKIFQDMLISDLDENVRSVSAKYIMSKYFEESLEVLEWAIQNEQSLETLTEILEGAKLKDKYWLSQILCNIFQALIENHDVKKNNIRFYVNSIKQLFSNKGFKTLSVEELIEMYQNYRILIELENKFQLSDNYCDCFSKDGYLNDLDLSGIKLNSILEIKYLDTLPKLESLNLTGNRIERIEGLENLENLGYLNLSFNRIKDINGLGTLINLEGLVIAGNKISEIKGLKNLKKLNFLDLSENRIKKICGLKSLKKLNELSLASNRITKIQGFKELRNLRALVIINNPIKKIKNKRILKKLIPDYESIDSSSKSSKKFSSDKT